MAVDIEIDPNYDLNEYSGEELTELVKADVGEGLQASAEFAPFVIGIVSVIIIILIIVFFMAMAKKAVG